MPDNTPAPKPSAPTDVREPSNTRSPDKPTPDKPMRPESSASKAQEPQEDVDQVETEGM
jgi:hypothetical protein